MWIFGRRKSEYRITHQKHTKKQCTEPDISLVRRKRRTVVDEDEEEYVPDKEVDSLEARAVYRSRSDMNVSKGN
ncbi:hypothetical protein PHLCEN_2v7506 [Hermanssonia centrifuga]|uniref:Uncharacterized protein n=1 Tax=Hermanssonia centrifuga TaxID=98765 RepID=A0A2R6NW90_9APHY|nr:hypothetical protein PHLCEN_2v7506 [Hermanssonia centrifuga]